MKAAPLLHALLHVLLLGALAATIASWLDEAEGGTRFFWIALAAGVAAIAPLVLLPRWRTSPAARRALRVVDLVAINVVLVVGLSELLLRAAGRVWPSGLFAPADAKAAERIRAWRLEPGSVHLGQRVNAQGFLDDPFVVERASGVRRIVALGDSFAIGVVDASKNFLTLLDQRLDTPGAPRPTEVLNFGIRSTDPRDYLHLWRTEARAFEPDLVLVCFFVGNDVQGTRAASFLHADSFLLFAFLRRFAAVQRELAGVDAKENFAAAAGATPLVPRFTHATFVELEHGRLDVCRRRPSRHTAKEWDDTLRVLDEMVRELGAKLRVAIVPDQFQVDDALFHELAPDAAGDFDRELPNRRLLAFCAERAVPCLDLLPPLRAAEAGGTTYAPLDTHWNERGNDVAATELARWLDGPAR